MLKSVCILILTLCSQARTETVPRLSLEEAKKFAVEHNFEVQALRKELEAAKAGATRAMAAYFPRLGVAGGANTRIDSRGNEARPLGYAYLNFNVFRGFEDSYRLQVSELEAEKAEIKLKRAEFRVGVEVEREFNLYLFKKLSLEIRNRALEVNNQLKRTASQRRTVGLVSDSDVMEFDLRDALIRSDMTSLEQEIEETRINLRRLLGEEIGSTIDPAGTLHHFHLKGSLQDYVKRIKDESETVQLTSRELERAVIESKLWKTKWLPTLDVQTQLGYIAGERPNDNTAGVNGLVLAKLDLFSGFENVAERREGEAKRLRLEAQLKHAVLLAVTQMEIAYRKIKAIEQRVHLEAQNEERARKYYNSVLSEYKRGVKNSIDAKGAAELLFEATIRRENFKYEFLAQKVELEKALGGLVEIEISPVTTEHLEHQ